MDERLKTNLDFWNECVPVHERSPGYRLEEFRKGGVSLFPIERDEVRDICGKSLLHLQCHFGLGTLSWARLGASVTVLDFSDQGIELARKIAAELNLAARFVCPDIYTAKSVIAEKFDIVFTSYGVLCWLPDLKKVGGLPDISSSGVGFPRRRVPSHDPDHGRRESDLS